jgi:hypothetical protein
MLVQTPYEEDSNKYFIPPKNLEYNEGGRLQINREDQNSHLKILYFGKLNIKVQTTYNEPICLFCKRKGGHFAQWWIFFCGCMVHFHWLISNALGLNIHFMCFFVSNFQCPNLCMGPLMSPLSMHISISMP